MVIGKYNNTKVEVDGIKFDSKEECLYYQLLKVKKEKGEVLEFSMQPKFVLMKSYKKYGKTVRAITYKPDFYVKYSDGREEYIDVKGMETQASVIRRKLFDYFYQDLTLRWVCRNLKHGDKDGWIDTDELKKIRAANRKKKKKKSEE